MFEILRPQRYLASPLYQNLADLNPLGWWKLNEPSGTICYDSSGNNFHGTYAGGANCSRVSPITLNSTGAIRTLANSSGAYLPYYAPLSFANASNRWSVGISYAWHQNAGGHSQTLIRNWASQNAGSTNWGLHLSQSGENEVGGWATGGAAFGTGVYVGSSIKPGRADVHRLWCVRNGSSMKLWRDGFVVGSVTTGLDYSVGAAQGVQIGMSTLYPGSYSSRATMSDAVVMDYPLSDAQILADSVAYGLTTPAPSVFNPSVAPVKVLQISDGATTDYSLPMLDDSGWLEQQGYWDSQVAAGQTIILASANLARFWTRSKIVLTSKVGLVFNYNVDDAILLYVNGVLLINTSPGGGWRTYAVPQAYLAMGVNNIAVRVSDTAPVRCYLYWYFTQ